MGPAEQLAGGSFCKSMSSFWIRLLDDMALEGRADAGPDSQWRHCDVETVPKRCVSASGRVWIRVFASTGSGWCRASPRHHLPSAQREATHQPLVTRGAMRDQRSTTTPQVRVPVRVGRPVCSAGGSTGQGRSEGAVNLSNLSELSTPPLRPAPALHPLSNAATRRRMRRLLFTGGWPESRRP